MTERLFFPLNSASASSLSNNQHHRHPSTSKLQHCRPLNQAHPYCLSTTTCLHCFRPPIFTSTIAKHPKWSFCANQFIQKIFSLNLLITASSRFQFLNFFIFKIKFGEFPTIMFKALKLMLPLILAPQIFPQAQPSLYRNK